LSGLFSINNSLLGKIEWPTKLRAATFYFFYLCKFTLCYNKYMDKNNIVIQELKIKYSVDFESQRVFSMIKK